MDLAGDTLGLDGGVKVKPEEEYVVSRRFDPVRRL